MLTVPPTKACLLCATPAGMDLYYIQVYTRRHLPSAVLWISEVYAVQYDYVYTLITPLLCLFHAVLL